MKKIIAMLLASVLVLGLMAGCTPAEEEEKVLKVAAIETAYGSEMWKQVCDAFTAQTGIKVELTTNKELEDVISASMQGGDYPDVIHLATGREDGLTEQFIFMPNGTWITGEMKDFEAGLTNEFAWGMTALPAVTAGGAGYSYTWFEQAWIPSGAENQEEAKQFVAFLYSDKACEIFAKAGAIQPVLNIADKLEGDNKLFYSIYDDGAKAAMGNFAAFEAIPGVDLTTVFFEPVNSLVAGTLTIEEYKANIMTAIAQMRENLMD